MISQEEFRFQRHLELWKDQNRNVKRATVLILLFGFLILFRVLIPFAENTEAFGSEIRTNQKIKAELSQKNEIIRKFEEKLTRVMETIKDRPWEREKIKLIRTFIQMNRRDETGKAQVEADKTIRAITDILRNDIVAPLAGVFADKPEIAPTLPALKDKIDQLKGFANEWETAHMGQRWYRTLEGKNREMLELTNALNARTTEFSRTLDETKGALNQQIQAGNKEIIRLTADIDQANHQLNDVLDQLFPKWMKTIINIQQMTQVFPMALVAMLLYLSWNVASMSHHFNYVARKLNSNEDFVTDVSTTSIWTLTDKSMQGIALTMAVYCGIILVVWVFFEKGIDILNLWIPMAKEGDLLMRVTIYEGVEWTGRAVFAALIILMVLHNRLLAISKNGFWSKVEARSSLKPQA